MKKVRPAGARRAPPRGKKTHDESAERVERLALEIAQRIRERRAAIPGMTNPKLAGLLGLSGRGIEAMMNGKSTKQFAKLVILAEVLQTDPNQLLGVAAHNGTCHTVNVPFDDSLIAAAVAVAMENSDRLPADPAIRDAMRKVFALAVVQGLRATTALAQEGNVGIPGDDTLRSQIEGAFQQLFWPRPRG